MRIPPSSSASTGAALSASPAQGFSMVGQVRRVLAVAALGLMAAAASQAQTVLVSNLNVPGGYGEAGPYYIYNSMDDLEEKVFRGMGFTTGATDMLLSNITLHLVGGSGGSLAVRLYGDGGSPTVRGALLETLSGNSAPSAGGDYSFTSAGTLLTANTTYWWTAEVTALNSAFRFEAVGSSSETGEAGWSITDGGIYSLNGGVTWGTESVTTRFSVAGMEVPAAVPEPSTYAALAGGTMLAFAAWRRRRADVV